MTKDHLTGRQKELTNTYKNLNILFGLTEGYLSDYPAYIQYHKKPSKRSWSAQFYVNIYISLYIDNLRSTYLAQDILIEHCELLLV